MRRLRFETIASEPVHGSSALAWTWADRLPEALTEFSFVSGVRPGAEPGGYTLLLGPVGYGKVSMTLELELSVTKEHGRSIRMQSVPGTGNADATITVSIDAGEDDEHCQLSIALEVSPHKPAAAFWPREWIEKASSASLHLAARKMLSSMRAAIEGGAAAELGARTAELRAPAAAPRFTQVEAAPSSPA